MAIVKQHHTKVVGLSGLISTINSTITANYNELSLAISDEVTNRQNAVTSVATDLSTHITGAYTPLAELVATINGSSSSAGSFRKEVSDAVTSLIAGASINFDTLKELQDWLMVEDNAQTLFTQLGTMRSDFETEDAQIRLDFAAADLSLSNNLTQYIDTSIAGITNGLRARLEQVTVTGDNIVLTDAPKLGNVGGINAIQNFARVNFTDVDGASYLAPVVADTNDVTGKTFTIQVDTTGEWDGKMVTIQYFF
jgi:hypothetical protein